MRIFCNRNVWRAFVRRAKRRFPKEYIEAAWGRTMKDGVHIYAFTDMEHVATKNSVIYDPEENKEHELAEKLQYLGTIHSHPKYTDASPSENDWRDAMNEDEMTIGILAIWEKNGRRYSKGVFWPQTRPLDITLQD
jgi:proteasome lid subunit RPN8/RPN11